MIAYDDVKDFIDYITMDDDGWNGVREDAPESAKAAWDAYCKREEEAEKMGVKL